MGTFLYYNVNLGLPNSFITKKPHLSNFSLRRVHSVHSLKTHYQLKNTVKMAHSPCKDIFPFPSFFPLIFCPWLFFYYSSFLLFLHKVEEMENEKDDDDSKLLSWCPFDWSMVVLVIWISWDFKISDNSLVFIEFFWDKL